MVSTIKRTLSGVNFEKFNFVYCKENDLSPTYFLKRGVSEVSFEHL